MRPVPALSDLSVTEFVTLSRMGFLPHGLVIGSAVYEADTSRQNQVDLWTALFGGAQGMVQNVRTEEITMLTHAVASARHLAIERMRHQAAELRAEGVVGVRLDVEHHLWRGGHQVVKFVAMGTAIAFDHEHGPVEYRNAPSLRLADHGPFLSDLNGQDFVALLRSGYRPVTVACGNCVYQLDPKEAIPYHGHNAEIGSYTGAFFDARETAMDVLQQSLFRQFPVGHPDCPVGIVGMTVTESAHRPQTIQGRMNAFGPTVPVVEFTAVGTAIAALHPQDPRRSRERPKPKLVVPLDR